MPDGSLTAKPDELEEVGIKPLKAAIRRDGSIHLNDLPGIEYHVVPETQSIYVVATDAARVPRKIDLDAERSERERPKPTSSTGAVLNYTLYSSSNDLTDADIKPFQGISGGFDARFFSPLGTVNQSFTASLSDGELQGFKRLNTTWNYSDPERMITYNAGDFVTRSLPWTRSVYLGGMQVERNFALRSDLVTLPMPVVSGSAAVPSTLEVYSQNVKTYTSDIPAGPFELTNLPVITGSGEAQVVIRDTLGRETRTTLPFYTSSEQLAKGLIDFSAEVGFPRRNYGSESNDYASDVFGTATMRYGLTNWLTLEGHAEGGADLLNGGIGATFPLGRWGATSLAVAGSQHDGQTGTLLNGSLELRYDDFSLYGRMQRSYGNYDDIASVSADNERIREQYNYYYPGSRIFTARMPRAVDQVSLSLPTLFSRSNITCPLRRSKRRAATKPVPPARPIALRCGRTLRYTPPPSRISTTAIVSASMPVSPCPSTMIFMVRLAWIRTARTLPALPKFQSPRPARKEATAGTYAPAKAKQQTARLAATIAASMRVSMAGSSNMAMPFGPVARWTAPLPLPAGVSSPQTASMMPLPWWMSVRPMSRSGRATMWLDTPTAADG